MEIIIALVVFGGILWFYYSRDGKKSDEVVTSAPDNVTAPYKVPEPAATTPIPLVVEVIPADTEATMAAPTKAKAPAKPKAPAKAKAPAAPKAKAPAKPRAPRAPKAQA
jgi:hypothetical protein